MLRSSFIIIASLTLSTSAWAAELPKSGNFATPTGWKAVDEIIPIGGRGLGHGVIWGVVMGDNPLHIRSAMGPYIAEVNGDTISYNGRGAWSDADGDQIFTEWTGRLSISAKTVEGPQTITGGTGKFRGIMGSLPFKCQVIGDKGQFSCTQQWTYQLPPNP